MPLNTADIPELLHEQISSLLIQPLETESVVLASGPRVFDTSSALRIPKLAGSSTPEWVGESELIPEHDVDFEEVRLAPNERKSLKTLVKFSNESVRESVVGLEGVLRARLVNDVARQLDTALLSGDGAGDSITGIVNQPGVQTGTLDVADADSLLDALALATAAEVTPNRWMVNSLDFIELRKLKDNNGRYLLESDVTRDATYRLFGVPVTATNKLEPGTGILANFSEVAVARDQNPSVKILDQRYAEYDQQAIRVTARYDLGLLRPEGVIVLGAGTEG